jgi:hypothetical protein
LGSGSSYKYLGKSNSKEYGLETVIKRGSKAGAYTVMTLSTINVTVDLSRVESVIVINLSMF